jgi:hypothetical protein
MKGERKPLYVGPVPVRTIAYNKLAALEKMLLQSQVLDELHHELLTDHQNMIQNINNKDTSASMKQNYSAIGNIWLSNKSIAPPQTVKHDAFFNLKNAHKTKESVNQTKAREYINEIRTATYQERFSRQCSRLFIFLHTFCNCHEVAFCICSTKLIEIVEVARLLEFRYFRLVLSLLVHWSHAVV